MTEETAKALIVAIEQLTIAMRQLAGNGASGGVSAPTTCRFQPAYTGARGGNS